MLKSFASLALVLLAAGAANAQDRPAQATIDAYLKSTFGKAPALSAAKKAREYGNSMS